jgi:hypothetical protein
LQLDELVSLALDPIPLTRQLLAEQLQLLLGLAPPHRPAIKEGLLVSPPEVVEQFLEAGKVARRAAGQVAA